MLSVVGIVLEEMDSDVLPINPTIIRVMRVLRIARGGYQWIDYDIIVFNIINPFHVGETMKSSG